MKNTNRFFLRAALKRISPVFHQQRAVSFGLLWMFSFAVAHGFLRLRAGKTELAAVLR